MKKRDIILDFTSLLDVTLIIIFFFVLFSHLDSEENKLKTEEKIYELEMAIEEAEEREQKATELMEQLEKDIQMLQDANERQASNLEEMMEYRKSGNIKMILEMQSGSFEVRVIWKNSVVASISSNANLAEELAGALQIAGYQVDDTIFCEFVFDGSLPGTAFAYREITKELKNIEKQYKFLYCSETDLSIGKD